MTSPTTSGAFPALRCFIGNWAYFITMMPFSEVASRVRRANEIHKSEGLGDMIQRELGDRVKGIAEYLVTQPERFFSAVVVGVYGGSPNWYPLDIQESPVLGPHKLSGAAAQSLGILELTGDERLFAIDGQHRIEAIKIALKTDPVLNTEELGVIFVAHQETDEGLTRTRRLFTTLNKYAKKVSKSEIIALDEDDAFAITTRRLVDEYKGLSPSATLDGQDISLVHFGGSQLPLSNRHSITVIETLYDLVTTLALPIGDTKSRKKLRDSRQSEDFLDNIYHDHVAFWEALRSHVSDVDEVLGSDPTLELAGRYRTRDGGHILLRPAGQQAFARATRILMDRGFSLETAVAALAETVLSLNEPPWLYVLWNPYMHQMIVRYKELAESLLLFMVGQHPRRQAFNLLGAYRRALDDDTAELDQIPRTLSL
jgi:DNA sulfur modification protein DndB